MKGLSGSSARAELPERPFIPNVSLFSLVPGEFGFPGVGFQWERKGAKKLRTLYRKAFGNHKVLASLLRYKKWDLEAIEFPAEIELQSI